MPGKSLECVLKLLSSDVNKEEFKKAWKLSTLELPACVMLGSVEDQCGGCVRGSGLYLRCKRLVVGKLMCKKCENSCQEEGRPRQGLWSERIEVLKWSDEMGRTPITWMEYLKKNGLSRADGEEFLKEKEILNMPESEWELKGKKKRTAVSDTSSEGCRITTRCLPKVGKKKSPSSSESHLGKNKAMLRVEVYQDTGIVLKINVENWTTEANEKFVELYGEGKEYGRAKKKKGDSRLMELQALLDEQTSQMALMRAQMNGGISPTAPVAAVAPAEVTPSPVTPVTEGLSEISAADTKKAAKVARKLKKEAERVAKEKILLAQIAALKQPEEEEEIGEFSDSDDDDEISVEPFEYKGVTYNKDDGGILYTAEGEQWGYIDDEKEIQEGERE